MITLNSSQQAGYEKILAFLLSDQKYFILSGGPGTGKSTLINHMSEHLMKSYKGLSEVVCGTTPLHYDLTITATTNSAVDSLKAFIYSGEISTIHSALGVTISNSGNLVRSRPQDLRLTILVIDEYTYIDGELYKIIDESTSKVILVGDSDQLRAVRGMARPLLKLSQNPDHILDIPERSKSPDILKVVELFKSYVHNTTEPDILDITGMSDVSAITEEEFVNLLQDPNVCFNDARIITHSNSEVIGINQAIRLSRGLPEHFIPGERVRLNRYVRLGRIGYKTDSEYTVEEHIESASIPTSYYRIRDKWGMSHTVPYKSSDASLALSDLFDLRSNYSSTVYKAQGRSEDTIYLHLSGFPNNISRSVLVRSLYVGASRARKKLIFVGDLSEELLRKICNQ